MNYATEEQLAFLSDITREKVEQRYPQTVAVYGACLGNGFAHFVDAHTVYAIDPSLAHLSICHDRYEPILNELVLIHADINHDPVPILPDSLDLVICHLFLEYVDLDRAFSSIRQALRRGGLLNVVLHRADPNAPVVNNTDRTTLAATLFQPETNLAPELSEEILLRYTTPDLRFDGRQTYRMPDGTSLISYDFLKGIENDLLSEESPDSYGFEWER